jgi:hypothetical protein
VRPYLEKTHHKRRAGGVAQGVGPEFKPQYPKKPKTKQNWIKQTTAYLYHRLPSHMAIKSKILHM